jgi:hypothetical protein
MYTIRRKFDNSARRDSDHTRITPSAPREGAPRFVRTHGTTDRINDALNFG